MELGELFQVGSSKRVLKSQWQREGVPFYRGREITRLAADGYVDNELFISESDYAQYASKYGVPQAGDIMITAIGTIGNSYIVKDGDRFYFKDASVLWLKRLADVNSEYINLWLKSPCFFAQLDKGNGATVDTLTISKMKSVRIELPPLPEQKRIVGILDEAFAGIATAKANAEKNLENARALFESQLNEVFTSAWESCALVPLAELTTDITDGDHSPPPKSKDGVPFITIGNINKESRKIDFSNTFRVPKGYFSSLKANRRPQKGDVLYTVTGSFGIPVLVDSNADFCFQRHIGLVRPKRDIDSLWLSYLLLSPQVFRQALDRATGTAQKTVSLTALRSFSVPVVALPEQRRVASELDSVLGEIEHLVSIYRQKRNCLDALKASVLDQAFTGGI